MIKPLHLTKSILLLLCICFFASCAVKRPVVVRNYEYDKDISFTIQRIEEVSQISSWSGGRWVPTKGNMFVAMYVTLKNNAGEKKPLDFNNFYLLDSLTHTKHKVEFAMLQTSVNMWANRDSEIAANDTKKRRLVFTYPKNQKATLFSANDHQYTIDYIEPGKK